MNVCYCCVTALFLGSREALNVHTFSVSSEGLLGFFLNAVTVVAFLKIRELRTPSNFLVFSLAMADMGISMNATVAAFSSFLR